MKIYKYKDNVDTDVIIPARYLNSFDAKELASHAMADIDPTFASTVEKGRYHCSRSNFGCGSSREHAPLCLKLLELNVLLRKALHVFSIVILLILDSQLWNVKKQLIKLKKVTKVEVDFSTRCDYK